MAATRRIRFPAPKRCWSHKWPGGWSSHAWTLEDVTSALSGGAWFAKSRHEFANREAALAAGVGSDE